MRIKKLTLPAGAGCTPISTEDAVRFFGKDSVSAGERRGDIAARGPWGISVSYRALAVTETWRHNGVSNYVKEYTLHGDRTMSARQSGFDLEGWVSIAGRKRSCFTSSILFQLPDNRLIDVAVIHVRGDE